MGTWTFWALPHMTITYDRSEVEQVAGKCWQCIPATMQSELRQQVGTCAAPRSEAATVMATSSTIKVGFMYIHRCSLKPLLVTSCDYAL
jgi:hypothetical protein